MDESESIITARADALVSDHEALMRALVAQREKHLTQAVVAERMGVSQPTVAGFERYDSNPTLSTLRRYALAVGARLKTQVIDDTVPEIDEGLPSVYEAVEGACAFVTLSKKHLFVDASDDWHGEVSRSVSARRWAFAK